MNPSLTELDSQMLRTIARRCLEVLRLVPQSHFLAKVQAIHPTPEQLCPGTLIVVRDNSVDKWICLRCPCGCGAKVQLSMAENRRPRWTARVDWLGRPSVEPSIRRLDECQCHFWVKRGQILWCVDSGEDQSDGVAVQRHPALPLAGIPEG